ncbi:trypsin-like peptidase domain-containing protein [Candidatus Vondammii sp. HM_W22]|uniref:trypsin-like peptidase domain-containing protein n=1 Tax=Candidatus Vondammii sp. HM_W22 TaxID=2687299 RepID=UPI002E7B4359|nr:trypsin-like peptidase domain-containing protein [Candidatus Vondammii sp. HM_W22]
MQLKKIIVFIFLSVASGLIAAYLAISLFSDSAPDRVELIEPSVQRSRADSGPASYADAVALATPSVVNIYTTKVTIEQGGQPFTDPLFRRFFGDRFSAKPKKRLQASLGSGVIIGNRGYILTNHHVIAEADEIRVVLANGQTLNAEVVGTDPDTDLAVLKTDTDNLLAITVGNSNSLRVGDVVLAIGNPFAVGQTVTMGIVSATGRDRLGINTFENFIQTDAAINPGNSGGALINAYGELVGINTAIFSKSGGSQGIGFAIPITLARGVMNQILKQGRVVRGWLGIAGQDITPELAESFNFRDHSGVLVSGILEGGPADQAGIEPGDIITQIGNHIPSSAHDILNIISAIPPGSSVKIKGLKGTGAYQTKVTVSERPRARKEN